MKRWAIALLCWMGWAAVAVRAHDPGLSTVQGRVVGDRIELLAGFAPADVQQLLPAEARTSSKMTPAEFVGVLPLLEAAAAELFEVRAAGAVVGPRQPRVRLETGDSVTFSLTYPRPARDVGSFSVRSLKIGAMPPGHRQYVIIADANGITLAKKLIKASDIELDVPIANAPIEETPPGDAKGAEPPPANGAGEATTFGGFLWLGVTHIWTGRDHLLFLFALLVVCRSFRSIVKIITCFTLAHSTTLALATLDLVNLPSRITEPAIAASIIYVGVENLLTRGAEPRGRGVLTFAFGLIHGFGFATVLRELGVGVGGGGVAMPLFTFNAGVELGQVGIAALVLPVIWQLRKNEQFVARGVPVLSGIVAAAGLYWFLERTVFS